jgi:hypothetical protein
MRDAWKSYWAEPFGMVKEVPSHTWAGFVTNHGSFLQSILLGFTGLRIRDGQWTQYPASLPEGWESIEVGRLWVQGKPLALKAVHGKSALLQAARD